MNTRLYQYIFLTLLLVLIIPYTKLSAQQITLQECRQLALTQNKKIKVADYHIEASKAGLESVNKNSLPKIEGTVMGAHLGKPLDALLPPLLGAATVMASQPIYAGGKIRFGKQAATTAVDLYTEQKHLSEAEVLLNVEKAYWQVVQVSEKITLAEKFIVMLQGLQKDLKNAYDAGLIYKNDLLKVDVSLNEAQLNLQKAKDGHQLAMLFLSQIIGKGDNINFNITDTVSGGFTTIDLASSFSTLQRPEIKVLNKAIELEQLQTKVIKADLKPTVGLGAGLMANLGKHINFKDGSNFFASYFAMVNVGIPIVDWGKTSKKVKEQEFKVLAKQEELSETKELINLEIQQVTLAVNQSVKKVELSQLSMMQAEENVKLTADRYEAGTIVGKDVLEAQALWQQAYSNLIDARAEYKIALAQYKKATASNN